MLRSQDLDGTLAGPFSTSFVWQRFVVSSRSKEGNRLLAQSDIVLVEGHF